MGSTAWIVTAALVLIAVVAIASLAIGGHRRRQLRELFGPDYSRAADVDLRDDAAAPGRAPDAGSPDRPDHRILATDEAARYRMEWERAQAGFVDRPAMALHDADTLVASLLGELGYPVDELDQLAEPGAGQPEAIERYRAVRRVNLRADASETTTDELREAFVRYRELFEELLQRAAAAPSPSEPGRAGHQVRS